MKFTKIAAGHYANADGTYFVAVDSYKRGHATDEWVGPGGQWAAVYDRNAEGRIDHNSGETIEWFATKREAIAACIEFSQREAKPEVSYEEHMARLAAHYAERKAIAREMHAEVERHERMVAAGCNVEPHDFVDGECVYCGTAA